jgi:outer membrane protein OmpA-like peptidoglycan-associated protein
MTKVLTTTVSLALTLALCGPAQAQLMRGGLGGGFGGSLGGGFGRGLPIEGSGTLNGSIDAGDRAARSTTHTGETTRAPKVRTPTATAKPTDTRTALTATTAATATVPATAGATVRAPALTAAPVTAALRDVHGRVVTAGDRVATRVGTARAVVEGDGAHVVFVPAIPDYAVRRTAIIESGIVPIAYADAPAYIDTQYQVLQNDLRGTGVDVVKRGQQIVLEMPSDVTFAFDKYDIQPRFRPVLDAVAQTLSKYSATYIDVDGHTDAIGSMAYNQVLSEKRAFSVANYLSERQVTPVRMHVEGFGKTEPIASNATIAGRAANRRVEIVLTPYLG